MNHPVAPEYPACLVRSSGVISALIAQTCSTTAGRPTRAFGARLPDQYSTGKQPNLRPSMGSCPARVMSLKPNLGWNQVMV